MGTRKNEVTPRKMNCLFSHHDFSATKLFAVGLNGITEVNTPELAQSLVQVEIECCRYCGMFKLPIKPTWHDRNLIKKLKEDER